MSEIEQGLTVAEKVISDYRSGQKRAGGGTR